MRMPHAVPVLVSPSVSAIGELLGVLFGDAPRPCG
jgi:hypothetical protein